jgi:hypothetical protein
MQYFGRYTRLAVSALALPGCPFLGATVAGAQSINDQGVAQRARPEYDPIGVDIGGLTLFPSITASLETTDNYRATPTNKQGDVYTVIQPEMLVRSTWSRHRLEARAYASPSVHFNLSDENVTQFGASASGTYDVSRMTSFRADLTGARFVESRSSLGAFRGTAEPVRYELFRAGLAVSQSFNDITLTANAGSERRNFHDVRLAAGAGRIDQDFRDVRFLTAGGSAQYDLRNGIGLIASGQYERARYDFRPGSPGFVRGVSLDRQSSGFNLQGGVTLELSRLVFGTIQAGYITRSYRDPRLRDLNGVSYSADILWNVTQLTSIRLRAARSVEETSATQIAGNRRNDLRIGVDHELYRNILLNGDVGYGSFRPNGPGVGGRELTLGGGARYLINRRFTLSGGGRYSQRTSSNQFLRYKAFGANASLRFAL